VQFAAAPGREALLLALAYEVERELRWDERKPAVWVGDMV
jgi:amidase